MVNEQRWYLRRRVPQDYVQRMQAESLDPILAQVLYARKIETPDAITGFLSGTSALDNPLKLVDMACAVERILLALTRQEPIVVYGDFDADGVCATTLLVLALQHAGAHVAPYIPTGSVKPMGSTFPRWNSWPGKGRVSSSQWTVAFVPSPR